MADAKVYKLGELTLTDVARELEDYLRFQKNLETEGVAQAENIYFIQARQTDGWKKFAGLDKAVQVKLTVHEDFLTVDVGAGRWVDKLGAATVGYVLFAPLMITAAIGAMGQEKLPHDIFDFVERLTMLRGRSAMDIMDTAPAPEPVPSAAEHLCAACGEPLRSGARFCSMCGAPVQTTCPGCGAEVSPGARFCADCGTKLI